MPSHVLVSEGQPSACTYVACPGAELVVVAGVSYCNNSCTHTHEPHQQPEQCEAYSTRSNSVQQSSNVGDGPEQPAQRVDI